MNDYEILNDFIDGELPPEQEPELFAALNANEELRNMMKHTIALNKAAKNPALASSPSAETTKAIFGKLGISVLPEFAEPVSKPEEKEKRRYLPMIASVAAVFLAMLAITISLQDNAKKLLTTSNSIASKSSIANYPIIKSSENVIHPITAKDTVVKYVYVQNKNKVEKDISNTEMHGLALESSAPFGRLAGFSNINYLPVVMNSNPMKHFVPINPKKINNSVYPEIDTSNLQFANNENLPDDNTTLGLTLEFRGSQNWLDPEPNIEPKKKALFNNNSIALMYAFSKDFSLGAEVRQENFFQKYQGFDRLLATESIYEQQPNFTSGGIFARYGYSGLGFVRPFVQLTGGGNETGLIARGMAGLVFNPIKNVSIIFGYEYSRLYYSYQKSEFTSDKKSFNYGMSYSF